MDMCEILFGVDQSKKLFICLQGLFPPGQGATIGVDFMIKSVEIDNEKVKVSHSEVTFFWNMY